MVFLPSELCIRNEPKRSQKIPVVNDTAQGEDESSSMNTDIRVDPGNVKNLMRYVNCPIGILRITSSFFVRHLIRESLALQRISRRYDGQGRLLRMSSFSFVLLLSLFRMDCLLPKMEIRLYGILRD